MKTRKSLRTGFAALGLLAAASTGLAQTTAPPPQTFLTTIYFDYSFNATNDGYLTGTDAAKALNNKFAFRRAYFTYENKINDELKFRFRIDADNVNAVDAKGSKDDKLRPFIKHLYLDWTGLLPNSSLKVGMVDTITFKLAEDRWGYRSVAKTLTDGYKDITGVNIRASSADLGFNLTGSVMKELRYGVMVTNGEGYSHPELNKFKKIGAYLQLVPVAGLSLFGYADTENLSDSAKALTYKADVFFEMIPNLTVAGEWFTYDNDLFKNTDKSHYKTGGWSIFGVYKAIPDKLNFFARYDGYQPNSTNANKDQSFVIVGCDWAPVHPSWKIQPNVWFYGYKAAAKKSDAVVNLTFFLSF